MVLMVFLSRKSLHCICFFEDRERLEHNTCFRLGQQLLQRAAGFFFPPGDGVSTTEFGNDAGIVARSLTGALQFGDSLLMIPLRAERPAEKSVRGPEIGIEFEQFLQLRGELVIAACVVIREAFN